MPGALPRGATVAVIGAGAMGAGIAQVAAQAGHPVRLFDTRIAAAEDARVRVVDTLAGLAARGKLDAAEAAAAGARITAVHALADCVSAGLVVEAIVEDLAAKRALLRELEVIVPTVAILASNTSSLSITELAAGLKHPGRVAGMHFFNPVPLMSLVEVVSGLATDAATAETLQATAVAWGKQPVHAASTPGFIVNRCARPFYGEALRLLAERAADPATLDAVMRESGGFRMGPFELMDLVGNDVNYAVTHSIWAACYHDPRYAPSVLQRERVVAGLLGRKSGRGFFDYSVDAPAPAPACESPQPAPVCLALHGDAGIAAALVDRIAAAGADIERHDGLPAFPDSVMRIDDAWLAMSDGRTATARAAASGTPNLVVFDLALDFGRCTRMAVACADTCDPAAFRAATGALQHAGIAVSRLDDVPALAVLRTVAMLANEAADALARGVATASDIDTAMQRGLNYPRGPLGWANEIGIGRIRQALMHLADHYGDGRYRVSPLVLRRSLAGGSLDIAVGQRWPDSGPGTAR